MADYELFAATDSDMQTALSALGLTQRDGRRGIVRYSVNYYGIKVVAGMPQPGVYAILRWVPASIIGNPFPPAGISLPASIVVTTPLPVNTPVTFFG